MNALKLYIESSKYQKKDIASALGVAPATISSWCSGKTKPHRVNIDMLSEILEVDPDILMGEKPVPLPESYDQFRLFCSLCGISFDDVLSKIRELES